MRRVHTPAFNPSTFLQSLIVIHISVHDYVERALKRNKLRYTKQRHRIIELLAEAGRPITMPELLAEAPELSQSSLYRNLDILVQANLVTRIPGNRHGNFELSGDLIEHHHHLVCDSCGLMTDVHVDAAFEQSIDRKFSRLAEQFGFSPELQKIDLHGSCIDCTSSAS